MYQQIAQKIIDSVAYDVAVTIGGRTTEIKRSYQPSVPISTQKLSVDSFCNSTSHTLSVGGLKDGQRLTFNSLGFTYCRWHPPVAYESANGNVAGAAEEAADKKSQGLLSFIKNILFNWLIKIFKM